jgi:hypothetical protein
MRFQPRLLPSLKLGARPHLKEFTGRERRVYLWVYSRLISLHSSWARLISKDSQVCKRDLSPPDFPPLKLGSQAHLKKLTGLEGGIPCTQALPPPIPSTQTGNPGSPQKTLRSERWYSLYSGVTPADSLHSNWEPRLISKESQVGKRALAPLPLVKLKTGTITQTFHLPADYLGLGVAGERMKRWISPG